MKKLKKFLIPLGIILAIVLLVVIMGAVKQKKALNAQFEVQPVTEEVENNDIGVYVSASGMLEAGITEAVQADTQGTVTEVIANAGDFVEEGQLLASVDTSDLEDLIETTKENIVTKKAEIDNFSVLYDSYTIKSPVNGRIKDVTPTYIDPEEEYDNNDDDETNDIVYEKCEDLEAKYGYLVEIAIGDTMWVVTEEDVDQYEVGQSLAVKVHEWTDYYYKTKVFVEKIEDGKAYISIPTNYRQDGKEATIYAEDGRTVIGTGTTEYLGMTYVDGYKGYITTTNAYINEKVSIGEILYYAYTTESQDLLDLYRDLENLESDLADYKKQLDNAQIKAKADGFINKINLVQGNAVAEDTIAYELSNTSTWQASVDVDELDINLIETGMKALVTVDAIPDVEFVGTVTDISSVGENSGGITTYSVEVELDADERFRINMNSSSEILVDESLDTLSIPIQAVRTLDDTEYVVVLVERSEAELEEIKNEIMEEMAQKAMEQLNSDYKSDDESDDKNLEEKIYDSLGITDKMYGEIRIVESGVQDETNIEVLSGLELGEVVILPNDQLSDDAESSTIVIG